MTKEEYLEYWKSMSHDELMVRCGLYLDRIEGLQRDNSIRNELLGSAQGDLRNMQARIIELEDELADVLDVCIARGDMLDYYEADADYRKRLAELTKLQS